MSATTGSGQNPMAPYEATLQHCQLLQQKIEKLEALRIQAEEQMFHSIARAFNRGEISEIDLYAVHDRVRAVLPRGGTICGYTKRWNAAIPINTRQINGRQRWLNTEKPEPPAPNGPGGLSWVGTYPVHWEDPHPWRRTSVVYVLFDVANDPAYVGSTMDFLARLKVHEKAGIPISSWAAYPCRDRNHAYKLEDQLLKQYKPRFNKKAGR